MWHVETRHCNKTLPWGVTPMEGQQKIYNIQSNKKTLLGKDFEVENINEVS